MFSCVYLRFVVDWPVTSDASISLSRHRLSQRLQQTIAGRWILNYPKRMVHCVKRSEDQSVKWGRKRLYQIRRTGEQTILYYLSLCCVYARRIWQSWVNKTELDWTLPHAVDLTSLCQCDKMTSDRWSCDGRESGWPQDSELAKMS